MSERSVGTAVALFVAQAIPLVLLWLFLSPSNPEQRLLSSIFTVPALLVLVALAAASSFEGVGGPSRR